MVDEKEVKEKVPSIWEREKFPSINVNPRTSYMFKGRTLLGTQTHPNGKKKAPFCWTPTADFYFGGKKFIPGYPCISWEGPNFGYIAQKLWDHIVIGRE